MHPIQDEDVSVLERLEQRIDQAAALIARLKDRNAQLEEDLAEAAAQRDAARLEAGTARTEAAHLVEQLDGLRVRQKEAASRVKNLLAQMEQMDLLGEG
jgi:outer membrane murein-binding lipoprotein Lpp